jgi:hypothetical protein
MPAKKGLKALVLAAILHVPARADTFEPATTPAWVGEVTRMAFLTPDQVDKAARAGVQVVHGNAVWPYYPLRQDGGSLKPGEDKLLRKFVRDCHRRGMKLVLGLPPFPPIELVKQHPDWRVHADAAGSILKVVPGENLGTRIGCNLGPWGDYLIELCAELVRDYHVDGFSFDGNYHPSLCYCPACRRAYRRDRQRDLPTRPDLDDVPYREYLVWRGERLEDHYRRLRQRLRQVDPDAVVMSWTVNAGRYGHFLYSPRAMPTRMNRLFDLPMQEWWLDETNLGASVVPAFGAAYLRAVAGDRTTASEAYLMSRGNPYGTDSFPVHERLTRNLLALANGSVAAESFGWPGHVESTFTVLGEVARRAPWLTHTRSWPWAALLVSEQTRQFYAYKDVPRRFLAHQLGVFRAAMEEHLPLTLINDWDVEAIEPARVPVLVLANAAALSEKQTAAIRKYVQAGGGLVATGETSLCDELGRPKREFALADVFGVSYRGRPRPANARPALDENFAAVLNENYWKQRQGVAQLHWTDHPLLADPQLHQLVPHRRVTFRGPMVSVSVTAAAKVIAHMTPEGQSQPDLPAIVVRQFGKGRVVYLAASIDAGLWSYAYPYQRRLLARAMRWAAAAAPPVTVKAPMCVQATYFIQAKHRERSVIVHLFNGLNTTANHGLPAMEVPLREETVPIHGIEVRFDGPDAKSFHLEPGNQPIRVRREGQATIVEIPRLEIHAMLVGER